MFGGSNEPTKINIRQKFKIPGASIRKLMEEKGASIVSNAALAEMAQRVKDTIETVTSVALELVSHRNQKKITRDDIKMAFKIFRGNMAVSDFAAKKKMEKNAEADTYVRRCDRCGHEFEYLVDAAYRSSAESDGVFCPECGYFNHF